jgi:hypothetical protein
VRQRLKLIVFAALSAALTVAGMSIAAGGNGDSGNRTHKQRDFLPPKVMNFDRDVAGVMQQIHQAVEKKPPEIADPIIQKAQDSGDITSDQADKLRAAAQALADGKRPNVDRALLRDADVRKVVQDAFAAARKQAPDIGEPIIQKALDENKITSAQADQIREQLKNPPPFGPGFGHGPGRGPGFDKHFDGPHGFGSIDKDVAAVLDDIHQAAEKKESAVAEPIIKKALDDGKITQAQADALRNHRPAGFDKDVFAVMQDIHRAAAKQVSEIAAPIIDKAVSDKKITESQASDIRDKLKNGPMFGKRVLRFRGGPPPFGGHGRPPAGVPPAPGNAPGAFPQGPPPDAQPAVLSGRPA